MLLVVLLVCVSLAASQQPPAEEAQSGDIGVELITALLNTDLVKNKLRHIYQLLDLKVRFLKLVKSLLTRENLLQIRRILDFFVRAANFVLGLLPEEEATGGSVLELFFPTIDLNHPENPNRVNRDLNVTEEDVALYEENKNEVMNLTKLIYNSP